MNNKAALLNLQLIVIKKAISYLTWNYAWIMHQHKKKKPNKMTL